MNILIDLSKEYGVPQQCFAQLLSKRKLLPVQHVGQVFQQVCKLHADTEDFDFKPKYNKAILDCLMQTMNLKLPLVGMRMIRVADEIRRNVEYVTLISDRNFSIHLSSASGFNNDELAVFRIWLKMMFDPTTAKDDIHIGELKVESALSCKSGMSVHLMKHLLQKLLDRMWIIVDDARELIRLHTFAVAELSASLQTEFGLPECELCGDVIIVQRLSEQCGCKSYFHVRCLLKILGEDSEVDCPAVQCELVFTRISLEQYNDEFESDDDVLSTRPQKRKIKVELTEQTQNPKRRSTSVIEIDSYQGEASSNSSSEEEKTGNFVSFEQPTKDLNENMYEKEDEDDEEGQMQTDDDE